MITGENGDEVSNEEAFVSRESLLCKAAGGKNERVVCYTNRIFLPPGELSGPYQMCSNYGRNEL